MKRTLVLLFVLFFHASSIIRLSLVTQESGDLSLGVETGAIIYVESNDDQTLLLNIRITNGDADDVGLTAFQLANLGTNDDGTKIGWKVNGAVTIRSANPATIAEKMTGFVYFTTSAQAQDGSFFVFSVDQSRNIGFDGHDLTLVFLNQNLNLQNEPIYVPQMSSYVSGLQTLPTTALSIYWDAPLDTYKNETAYGSVQQRVFANPLLLNGYYLHFDTVEPFQMFNEVWYIRSNGRVQFNVKPKWVDPNGSTTSSVTTTGLVTCSYAPENVTINLLTNSATTESSGVVILYNVISAVVFKIGGLQFQINNRNDANFDQFTGLASGPAATFQILSDYPVAGTFAVQYFHIDGPLPHSVLTTTNVAPKHNDVLLIITFCTISVFSQYVY